MNGKGIDPNLDPRIEAVFRKLMNAADDLETVRLRVERTDVAEILNQPSPVTDDLMSALAAAPNASSELAAYAARVTAGEVRWCDIEQLARPVPREVAELKASPNFIWQWTPQPPSPPPSQPVLRPTATKDNVVGPSDWPDDFDDYPTQKSWLV